MSGRKRSTQGKKKHAQKKKSEKFNKIHNFISHLVVSGRELLVGVANEDDLVDKPSKPTTDKWPSPVDPVVGPAPAYNSWAEWHGWVHGCSGEGSSNQNVSTNNETNCNWCNNSNITLLWVNGSSIHGVHQTEGQHDLQHQSGTHSNSSWKWECWNRLRCTVTKLSVRYLTKIILLFNQEFDVINYWKITNIS